MKSVHNLFYIFFNESLMRDVPGPVLQLGFRWELAVQQQVSDYEVGAFLGKYIDRDSAIFENSLVAVDERNPAFAGSSVHESRIVSHQTKVIIGDFDLAQIQRLDGFVLDRQFVL